MAINHFVLFFFVCEVFANAKVKLLRSEVCVAAQVKLSLPLLRRKTELHSQSELHYHR